MIDASAFQLLLMVVTGWLARREREVIVYLIEENRCLRRQLGSRRVRLTDDDRRRLAARAYRVGRRALRQIATIATPDTLLRWHRQLIARKWTYRRPSVNRGQVLAEIRHLVVRMADENQTWGYTRIQGALKNGGHCVGRSTIRRILKAAGLPPVPHRPTSWQTFLKAHWGVIAAADFFTTEVWTWRGLVTEQLTKRVMFQCSADSMVHRNHSVEAFFFDRSHEALRKRIRVRRPHGRQYDAHPRLAQEAPYVPTPFAIAITDQRAVVTEQTVVRGRQRATDLGESPFREQPMRDAWIEGCVLGRYEPLECPDVVKRCRGLRDSHKLNHARHPIDDIPGRRQFWTQCAIAV